MVPSASVTMMMSSAFWMRTRNRSSLSLKASSARLRSETSIIEPSTLTGSPVSASLTTCARSATSE